MTNLGLGWMCTGLPHIALLVAGLVLAVLRHDRHPWTSRAAGVGFGGALLTFLAQIVTSWRVDLTDPDRLSVMMAWWTITAVLGAGWTALMVVAAALERPRVDEP